MGGFPIAAHVRYQPFKIDHMFAERRRISMI
jgi:hypothetical protein